MKCSICNKNPIKDKVILHRMNPVGELPAVWVCFYCLSDEEKRYLDREVVEITKIINES